MCKLISFLRFIGGLLSLATLGVGGYFYINHYEDLDCGNMKIGITLGLCSVILFLFNIITFLSSCNKWWVLCICGLFLWGSTAYNIYITENLDEECKEKYEEKDIWEYYYYLYISMIVLSAIFLGLVLTSLCCKKDNSD